MGEAAVIWLFGLGCGGFAIGSAVVFTMPAPVTLRLAADAVVLLAAVVGVGLVVIGVPLGIFGFFAAPVLIPACSALGLRYLWSRIRKSS